MVISGCGGYGVLRRRPANDAEDSIKLCRALMCTHSRMCGATPPSITISISNCKPVRVRFGASKSTIYCSDFGEQIARNCTHTNTFNEHTRAARKKVRTHARSIAVRSGAINRRVITLEYPFAHRVRAYKFRCAMAPGPKKNMCVCACTSERDAFSESPRQQYADSGVYGTGCATLIC